MEFVSLVTFRMASKAKRLSGCSRLSPSRRETLEASVTMRLVDLDGVGEVARKHIKNFENFGFGGLVKPPRAEIILLYNIVRAPAGAIWNFCIKFEKLFVCLIDNSDIIYIFAVFNLIF